MKKLTAKQESLLQNLASILGVSRDDLFSLINFESAGWNPLARNKLSGARGLLQFTNSTARGMGYASADDLVAKHPSIESQLEGPVYNYLKQFIPFTGKQSLYMAVFYPKYRNVHPLTHFPDKVKSLNPGIFTAQDYIDYVDGKKKLQKVIS